MSGRSQRTSSYLLTEIQWRLLNLLELTVTLRPKYAFPNVQRRTHSTQYSANQFEFPTFICGQYLYAADRAVGHLSHCIVFVRRPGSTLILDRETHRSR